MIFVHDYQTKPNLSHIKASLDETVSLKRFPIVKLDQQGIGFCLPMSKKIHYQAN